MFDWFTAIAQLLNFLALIWLLKRFLYQPILTALDSREQKISAELADATHQKQQAKIEHDEFLRKNQDFEQQRLELFKRINDEAKIEQQRLLDQARQEANDLRIKQQQALQDEQKSLIASISLRTQTEILAMTRRALQDLAGVSLESHIISVFVEKLHNLTADEKQHILIAAKNPATPLSVRTAFALSPHQKTELLQVVKSIFSLETELQFEVAPHLITGIELSSDGQKFSWCVADYLVNLEKNINALMQPHT